MKKISVVALAALASSAAVAADLPSRRMAVAPQPAPVFVAMNWSGFYVGGQLGWIQGQDKVSMVPAVATWNQTYRDNAMIGGVHAGYNYQINSVVLGVQADANITGVSRSITTLGGNAIGGVARGREQYEGSLVGRLGYSFGNAMIYGLGGVALANYEVRYTTGANVAKFDDTRVGWTVGAGAAYKFAPNWSANVEYRYADYGKENHVLPAAVLGGGTVRHAYTTQRVTVGLSYHFGAPASAVVAKY